MVGIEDRRFFHSSDGAVEECEPVLYSCSDFNLLQHILLNALKEMLFPSVKLCFAHSHTTYRPIYTAQMSARSPVKLAYESLIRLQPGCKTAYMCRCVQNITAGLTVTVD